MPKYWVKNYFAHGIFPEVGQKQKTERKRPNDGNNNGQGMHGASKHAWCKQAVWANTHGARKHAWRTQAAWANSILFIISS